MNLQHFIFAVVLVFFVCFWYLKRFFLHHLFPVFVCFWFCIVALIAAFFFPLQFFHMFVCFWFCVLSVCWRYPVVAVAAFFP